MFVWIFWSIFLPVLGRKLSVQKTFGGRPRHLLKVKCTFNLRPASRGLNSFALKNKNPLNIGSIFYHGGQITDGFLVSERFIWPNFKYKQCPPSFQRFPISSNNCWRIPKHIDIKGNIRLSCVKPLCQTSGLCFQVVSKVISGMKWVSNQCFTHIQNICRANQFSGFYIIETLVYSELKNEFCKPLKTKYSHMVDYQQQSIRK